VLDDVVISAYERIPLCVEGDGRSSIKKLLEDKQVLFDKLKRDTVIKYDDIRIAMKLSRQKLSYDSILPVGKRVFLLDNANLSTGGDSVDVTHCVHPRFEELAVRLTKDMGLRLCGVDLITQGDISNETGEYWILEVNAAPGLDHYARSGEKQRKDVEALYTKVLQSLEKL
jgi:D-alanine-D-alanine ligase-like ATP-grasp enzyme